ncbi:tetratricopeptide repeat protein [Anaeromyxobacter terrae]|uniref:tetratricopeptide repeat protein n=1 Tax=Anaeromyxobacter terrae TaxID=2925406 RepID=UPI001F593DD7|nr:tetratricopeptide repeat protein [Anaeromyxobacter sp. SG22]
MLLPRARAPGGSRGESTTFRRRGEVVALALLLGACWYPKERGARLEQRVDRIEGEAPAPGQTGAEAAAIEAQSRRVDVMLAEVKTRLEALEAREAASKAGAKPSPPESELAEELKRLRGMLEQQAQRLDAVEKTLAQAPRGAGERVAEPRHVAPQKPQKPAMREVPQVPQAAPGKTDYLALGREQELKGEKTVARELYEQYATEFPSDPSTAEARFRLGELAFGERRYRDAIVEFGKVAREFPRSERAPEALLRTADSMLQLDLKDDAATLLVEIPRRYPGTPAAARAKKLLAELPKASAAAGKPSD